MTAPAEGTPWPVPDLELDGVRLSRLTEAVAPELVDLVPGDPEIVRWSSVGAVTDLDSALTWARSRVRSDHVEWAIRVPDGRLAGRVSLHRIDSRHGTAEVGYGLFQAFRGQGLARRVVLRVTGYAFADVGLRRIELEHGVGNTRSCRVAQTCGYALEGTRRQGLENRQGGWEDSHLHARLSTD